MPGNKKAKAPGRQIQGAFSNAQPGWDRAVLDIMETLSYLAPLLKSHPPTWIRS